jgi:hypothetical protein
MMKIVDFFEFAKLPPGTIYMRYEPEIVRGLEKKGATLYRDSNYPETGNEPSDFFYSDILPYVMADGEGIHWEHDEIPSRWGLFDFDEMFMVLEDEDVKKIIEMLETK